MLFADDTLMYLAIKPKSNAAVLQEDLDKIARCEMFWNSLLGFLRRNLQVTIQVYFALVRPHLENSNTVWDPYTHTQIEIIQCHAARYVLHRHHNVSSVTDSIGRITV